MELKVIKDLEGVILHQNINLEKYTTIKLGKIGNIAICETLEGLKKLLHILTKESINYHLVGWGANQVLLNVDKTLFIKLNFKYNRDIFKEPREVYDLPASVGLNILTSHATKFGLKGWEVFTGIPASLGGAIYMNAGTSLGEIGDLIESVDILKPDGTINTYRCVENSFNYRKNNFVKDGEVIISAKIKHLGIDDSIPKKIKDYLDYRKSTQPLTTKNCGSVFKNHSTKLRAGQTIDTIGLKNFGYENLKVTTLHANFVENSGNATSEEFKKLVDCLKIDIERYSGRKFVLEVKVY